MHILLLEPFGGGSHLKWAEGYRVASRHQVTLMTLPGRHWKWRMHGAAITLARRAVQIEEDLGPDLILATDMLDLATFLGITGTRFADIPVALYFHENQLAYPWSPEDADVQLQRDRHYAFLNYTSALAADRIYFNSPYNRDSFLGGLPAFLKAFPDHRNMETVAELEARQQVLPLGMNLRHLEAGKPRPTTGDGPVLLWNHRWEYDKGPDEFFQALYQLQAEGMAFQLIVLGEAFSRSPGVFAEARERLADRILHWGYAESAAEYADWLATADVLPVTSRQDFFGGSVVEAMYAGCVPLLPHRLAYPMHIPTPYQPDLLYTGDLLPALRKLLTDGIPDLPTQNWVAGYDWNALATVYDEVFSLQVIRGRT